MNKVILLSCVGLLIGIGATTFFVLISQRLIPTQVSAIILAYDLHHTQDCTNTTMPDNMT